VSAQIFFAFGSFYFVSFYFVSFCLVSGYFLGLGEAFFLVFLGGGSLTGTFDPSSFS
jgi:hypothetical protein